MIYRNTYKRPINKIKDFQEINKRTSSNFPYWREERKNLEHETASSHDDQRVNGWSQQKIMY